MSEALRGALVNRRVLVAEDEYFIARDISRSLRALGAEVIGPVPSLGEALALLSAAEHLEAAILDINLDGEMVFPVLDALAARNIPVLIATGYGREAIPDEYRHLPRWQKPFEASGLAEALLGIVDAR